jgi:molybdopterin-guanine dinucleotide biosynthesis protein A
MSDGDDDGVPTSAPPPARRPDARAIPVGQATEPGPPPLAVAAPRVAGIVLAGGRSRRFGTDKLAARYGDGSLLDAALRAVAEVVDEVIVAIGPAGDEPPLPGDLRVPACFARDTEEGGGPLAALPAALDATGAPVVLVVAGDTPVLPPGVARALLDALAGPGPARAGLTVGADRGRALAAALLVGGSFQQLPFALRREPALRTVIRLLAEGERRLLPLFVSLGATAVPEDVWRREDRAGLVLRDVDSPADLADLP